MGLINHLTYFWHGQKLKQYLCLAPFSIVIYESSIPTNYYSLAFIGLFCKFFCSHLEIINLILEIFRDAISAYITEYRVLSYIQKLMWTVGLFSYVLLVNMSCMSYYFRYLNYAKYFRHVQKMKHCLCFEAF